MTSTVESIKQLRDRLDDLDLDHQFTQEILESGIFENWDLELMEASTLIKQFGGDPQGMALSKYLHANYKLSDRAGFRPHDMSKNNLAWKNFKSHYDNFVIFQGEKGWAAAKPETQYLEKHMRSTWYRPDTDTSLPYEIIYSVEGEDGIQVKVYEKLRGGLIRGSDPRNPNNITNMVKERIGKIKQVWYADSRDPQATQDQPPETLAGRRSRRGTEPGASVERSKIAARGSFKGDEPEVVIATRLWRLLPNILRQVRVRMKRKGTASDWSMKRVDDILDNQDIIGKPFDPKGQPGIYSMWFRAVKTAIENLPGNYEDNLKLAAQGKSDLIQPILVNVRDQLSAQFN